MSLFYTNSRDKLVTLLGFSKKAIVNKVSEVIERLRVTVVPSPTTEGESVASGVRELVVAFVEPDQTPKAKQSRLSPLRQTRVRARHQTLLM